MRVISDAEPPHGGGGAGLREHLFAGLSACSAEAAAVADALLGLTGPSGPDGTGLTAAGGGLAVGAVLADDLVLLARAAHLLEAEAGLRAAAADRTDATPTGARSVLRAAGWTRSHASALLEAGGLAAEHPQLVGMWRTGAATSGKLAAVAVRSRPLTARQRSAVVDALVPYLPRLSASTTRMTVDAAVDAIRPEDAEKREQLAYDRRHLVHSVYADMLLIEARLPLLEGRAFLAAVEAHAEKLRAQGDRLTKAQRMADGLTALVAAAAADGALPTIGGLPAAVTITIPLAEADRLTGHTHTSGSGCGTCSGSGGGSGCGDGRGCTCGGGHGPRVPIRPGGRIDRAGTLGAAAGRFLMCCADLTGVLVHHPEPSPLAALLGAAREEPLAVGRTQRLATPAQRKALAIRDKGCVVAGCAVAPQHCQPHHTKDWADGGTTDLDTLALLCWPHHRQVDLGRWDLTRNPDPAGAHWTTTPTPRHTWKPRRQ